METPTKQDQQNLTEQSTQTGRVNETKLFQVVKQGMIVMLARNLDYAPAAEDLPKTAKVMTHDLFKLGYTDDDSERIARAIDEAGRTYARFPTVFHIKQHILRKSELEFRGGNKALPKEVELTPEQKQQAIKRKDEAMAGIRKILQRKTKYEEEHEKKKAARELRSLERIKKNEGSIYDVMPDHIAKQMEDMANGNGVIRSPEEIEKDL